MSKREHCGGGENGDTTETRRVKQAVGGAVIEGIRKWSALGLIAWMAAAQGLVPIPGVAPKPPAGNGGAVVTRAEFQSHEKWGEAVKLGIESRIVNVEASAQRIELSVTRIEQRLDRLLDRRSAWLAPTNSSASAIAHRP